MDAIEFLITRPQRTADISASLLACGKPQEALQLIDEGFDQVRRDGWQEAYYEADMWRIRGRILCALGAPDEALRAWREGIRVAKKRGLVRAELMIAVEQARLLEELGKGDEAESLLAAALRIPEAAGCRAAYAEAAGLLTSLPSAASHLAGERK